MKRLIKTSRRALRQMIKNNLSVEGIDWADVGDDGRRWGGGMKLAKYPGPWASGHESLVEDEKGDREEKLVDEKETGVEDIKVGRSKLRDFILEEIKRLALADRKSLGEISLTREQMLKIIQSELEDGEESDYLTVDPRRKISRRKQGG